LRKPAFVLAVAALLAALAWLYFMDDRDLNRQSASPSPTIFQEKQAKADVVPLQSSAPNRDRDGPQMQTGHVQAPADSVSEASTEQQLVNAAATQFDLSKLTPVEVDLPVDTDPAAIEKGGTESIATEGPATLPEEAVSAPVEAPIENKLNPTAQSDVDDGPSPLASAIEASTVSVDEAPQELPVTPPPTTPSTGPAADEGEFENTESDPRAIIDFLIRKRAQQPGSQ
jgi:hypothetical protein